MNRWEAIEIFNRLRDDAIVVHGTGGMGIEVNTKSPSDLNIYAPMPYPTPVGLGMALALPKQRIVITEGDGSALSGISGLATVANMAPANVIHIVWDNGAWMSPGTMGTRRHYGPLPTAAGGRTDTRGFCEGRWLCAHHDGKRLEGIRSCAARCYRNERSELHPGEDRSKAHARSPGEASRDGGTGN